MELEGNQPELTRTCFRQKSFAFLVTALSLLGILSIGWACLIKGYQVRRSISIQTNNQITQAEIQSLVANAYRKVSTKNQLESLIADLRQRIPVRSPVLMGGAETLQNSLGAETVAASEANVTQIQIALRGNGSREERIFLSRFCDAMKMEISQVASVSNLSSQLVIEDLKMARIRSRLAEIQNSATTFEANYEAICKQMENIHSSSKQTPFRSASHKASSSESVDVDLQKLMESGSGKKIANDIQNLIEESWSSSSSNDGATSSEVSIVPIGGPELKNFLVLIILAAAGGLVTAIHYQPFAYRGFTSISAVSQRLKLPVLATLSINQYNGVETVSNHSIDRKIPWANRLADVASIFFFATIALIIGFCIFSEEIRHEFLRNPFDGVTRMLWFLMGH